MSIYHQMSKIKPTAEMLASQVAHQTLALVIEGIENPKSSKALRSKIEVDSVASKCGKGTMLVMRDPKFRAAKWLV